MDSLVKRFDFVVDKDLVLCNPRGVAYQKDMKALVTYDKDYFDKCAGYNKSIANKVNEGRSEFVNRHYKDKKPLLDIGIGSGEFILKYKNAKGYDVNSYAVEWLKENNRYSEDWDGHKAFTFWDTLEHVSNPNSYFKHITHDSYVFVSIPIFDDLTKIRDSKHYRPGEHLYYWTEKGFVDWMSYYGFRLLEVSDYETDAGREGIKSFAFKKDLPGYHEFIFQYTEMHAKQYYGASAKLYLKEVGDVVRNLNPNSILDYGCGRSELAIYFWKDGQRRIERYDPAISDFKSMPEGQFDLVICCDVMEHIPVANIDQVFKDIRSKSPKAVFVISTKPSRARLPSGQNAHITLLTKNEWFRWLTSIFGGSRIIDTQWDHVLMVSAGIPN